ncbi:MAG TPA: hypothetical protein VGE52_19875, partial [Pirellulales bacterium]
DDAKAAAQWGRFVAFYATDFAQGLPLLARGDDELATIARQELARPKDAAARTAIGDGWRSLAAAEPDDRAKKAAATRAAGWYRKALPDLYGLSRKQVELRLAEVEAVVPPLPLGEWVDLIPSFLIDERGAWSRRDDVLGVFRESRWDKCPAPFIPEGSYELRVRFRFPGEAQLFRIRSPAGSGCCVVAFWDFSGAGHRITTLAEERLPGSNASPPTPEAVSRREYVAGVAVTVRGERVRIVGTLDGRQVSAWEGPAATLGDNPRDSRQVRCLRLETQGHPVEVTEVQIRVKDGRIRQGTE